MSVTIGSDKPGGPRHTAQTTRDGFAEFWLPRDAEYSIEVEAPGFKRRRIKGVRVGPALENAATAYVQVQVQVDRPKIIVQ